MVEIPVQIDEPKVLVDSIPFKVESKSATEQGTEVLLFTVALLVVAVIVLLWVRKKLGVPRNTTDPVSERLSVVKRVRIGAQSSVLVVSWRNKEYLLAHSANTISKIDEFPQPQKNKPE